LAGSVSGNSITLQWNASTDNVGVTGYRVYRNGALVATVGTTSWTNNGLSTSTTYAYTVSAIDAAGNESAQSTALSVRTGKKRTTSH
jgi:chitodextrinase